MAKWSMKSLEPNSPPKSLQPPLTDAFFTRPALAVGRELLGKGLFLKRGRTVLLAELAEVEAYLGNEDPASHADRRRTPRNTVMFERGGACYVYLSYGMSWCMNVVTGLEGEGQAVLLRAAKPLQGLRTMYRNRNLDSNRDPRNLLSGPGKLAQAFGISLDFNGRRFSEKGFQIVDLGIEYSAEAIAASPRIGITKAAELPYRFTVKGSPWLSRKA